MEGKNNRLWLPSLLWCLGIQKSVMIILFISTFNPNSNRKMVPFSLCAVHLCIALFLWFIREGAVDHSRARDGPSSLSNNFVGFHLPSTSTNLLLTDSNAWACMYSLPLLTSSSLLLRVELGRYGTETILSACKSS